MQGNEQPPSPSSPPDPDVPDPNLIHTEERQPSLDQPLNSPQISGHPDRADPRLVRDVPFSDTPDVPDLKLIYELQEAEKDWTIEASDEP